MDGPLVDRILASAYLADAHADSLMWNRDLSQRSTRGHVDFPRLVEAGSRLQCFTLVTRGLPLVGGFGALAAWNGWPRAARRGEWARANWQIDQLERFCARSRGAVAIAGDRGELAGNEAAGRVSAVLGVEGAHALEGRVARVEALWRRGVRFMSLTHLSNNEAGGSSFHLSPPKGLTRFGREVLGEMARLGMAVDVAHASRSTLDGILEATDAPVFCSHTGLDSVTRCWRNLDDATVGEIARRGGVVCVIFATVYLGGRRLEHLVRHLERALEVAGEDHVGLGSDFDGMIDLPRGMGDVRGVRTLARALLERGLAPEGLHKVLGANLRRFLVERVLPGAGPG